MGRRNDHQFADNFVVVIGVSCSTHGGSSPPVSLLVPFVGTNHSNSKQFVLETDLKRLQYY